MAASHSKVKTNDEFDCAKHWEGSISDPNVLASTASESPVKTRHESQSLLSSQAEKNDRTERPVVCLQGGAHRPVVNAHSAGYSGWDDDKAWSSQEWKSDELMDRTVRPVVCPQEGRINSLLKTTKQNQNCRCDPDHSKIGRMIKCEKGKNNPHSMQQKTAKNILWYWECSCLQHCNHLYSWRRINQTHSIKKHRRSHTETDVRQYRRNWYPNNLARSMEWKQLTGTTLHGSICLWSVMKKSSVSCTQRSTYFQILYYAVERWTRTLNPVLHGKTDWRGSKVHRNTEPETELMVSQWNSSGISSKDSRCSSVKKSKVYGWDWVRHQRILQEGLSSCRCSTTSHCGSKDNEKECESKCSTRFSICRNFLSRTMVVSRSWFREKVVFYQWRWSTRWMGQNGGKDDGDTRRKRTSSLPCHESIVQRSA